MLRERDVYFMECMYVYCEHRTVMTVILKSIETKKNKILNILDKENKCTKNTQETKGSEIHTAKNKYGERERERELSFKI